MDKAKRGCGGGAGGGGQMCGGGNSDGVGTCNFLFIFFFFLQHTFSAFSAWTDFLSQRQNKRFGLWFRHSRGQGVCVFSALWVHKTLSNFKGMSVEELSVFNSLSTTYHFKTDEKK